MRRDVGYTYVVNAMGSEFYRSIELGQSQMQHPKRALEAFPRYLRKGSYSIDELFFLKSFHSHWTVFNRRHDLPPPWWPKTWTRRIDDEIIRRRETV